MTAGPATAQVVQRSFINLGFEQPVLTPVNAAVGCVYISSETDIPGWNTNHPGGYAAGTDCSSPAVHPGPLIEMWRTNFNGVPARSGVNFAELNAYVASRMYQNICLVAGERISWRMSHRARENTDVMSFNIDSSTNQILRASTNTAGVGTVVAGSCGSGGVTSATCNTPTTNNTWADYTGVFTWNGAPGMHSFGFEAISAGSGIVSVGNFLDDIQITIKPYVQFAGGLPTLTYTEGGTTPTVNLQIVGVVPTGGFTLPLTVTGTASLGSDYTLTSNITIPAGDFSAGTLVNVPLTLLNDTVIENDETLVLTIPDSAPTSPYVLANTNACGAQPLNRITINILDNDIDVLTTKSVSTTAPLYGIPFTYTVAYTNNTGATSATNPSPPPATIRTTSHDVTTAISDPVPTGLTFSSWTCEATGTAGTACPAANGIGAITGNAVLPAGGTVTYKVTATLTDRTCAVINNTSTISVPSGFTEGTSVQSDFTSPPPGGAANNTATVSVTPQCTDLRISKTNTATGNNLDAPSDTLTSGQNTTYTLLVQNGTPAVTGAVIRDTPGAGITCPATGTVTCAGSACLAPTYQVSNLTGSGITLGTLPANGSVTLTFSCTVN